MRSDREGYDGRRCGCRRRLLHHPPGAPCRPTGKVYANDIQPEMLSRLQDRLDAEHLNNVSHRTGTQSDPKLPAGQFDSILMVDVYHELAQPQRMLAEMRRALKATAG